MRDYHKHTLALFCTIYMGLVHACPIIISKYTSAHLLIEYHFVYHKYILYAQYFQDIIWALPCSFALAGYKNSAITEQFHPKYPQIGNQQTSEHSATYFHPNQLNSAAINTGHYSSLPPSTVSQQIPSSQQHSSLGPSRLPSQG